MPQLCGRPPRGLRPSPADHALQPRHVQEADLEVDLVPAQRDELPDAQPVSVGEQHQPAIARAVPSHLARGLQELVDLVRR